ncbi:MAG TPA: SDR family NAD(P)-dependent oxidoreductase, partial [Rubrobacter sp.]|nr:SDR family NAD(P)-dependent oxidoreductase [Rubrobacter sp.]
MQDSTLSGKTAVVVGASSGIGLATANLLSDSGATVHAAARRKDAIEEGAEGRAITAHELDISDEASVRRTLGGIGDSDGIDVLVVAAGMNFPERRLEQLTGESWDAMISVNLSGAFYAVHAALPYLRASQGLAVLVSSVSGSWPDASGPAYQASKAGMTELAHAAG